MEKKKVLFVLAHFEYSNGIASTLRTLINTIDQKKFEVHILPLFRVDKNFLEPIKNKCILHKGFGFYFKGFGKIVRFIPNKFLYRFLVKNKYDLEVAYQFFGTVSNILSVSNNPNKISWLHIINPHSEREITAKGHLFSKIITVSNSVGVKLNKMGIKNTSCCYNLIDEEFISALSNEPIELNNNAKIIITVVARISPEKAFLRQLRCFKTIYDKNNRFECWIIGDGPEMQAVKDSVELNNMNGYVKLLGKQNNPYKYIAKSDLYFCGSFREGFSTACQEAAILGIPVVTTEVDGAQELIELTGCGEVIPNNEHAIIERLTAILSDKELLSSWKKTAEINKINLYKQPRIAKIEKVLEQAIDKS